MACLASSVCISRGHPRGTSARSAEAHEVAVRIHGNLGAEPLFMYPTDLTCTVAELKEAIERIEGTPIREQRLLLGGRQLCRDTEGDSTHHLPLYQVLPAICFSKDGGSRPTVDVALVRLTPDWAQMLEALELGQVGLGRLDPSACAERELVLAAVSRDGSDLAYAAEELRGDRDVVLAAVRRDPLALQYAAATMRDHREVVLQAVGLCGLALQHASKAQQSDAEVVLVAMASSWRALEHASDVLRADRSFALAAVEAHGSALLFLAPSLRSDREIVIAAVHSSGWALSCASEELRRDRAVVLAAVTCNPAALEFAADILQRDPEVLALVSNGSGRRIGAPCSHGPPACSLQ